MTPLEEAHTFLTALFAPYPERDLWAEFRFLPQATRRWFTLNDLDQAARACLQCADYANICVGVFPRTHAHDGTKEAVASAAWLYADFDGPLPYAPDFPEPNLIVETSPGKFHAYWRLAEPVVLAGRPDGERANFAGLLERFVTVMGADPCAKDLARILRVPGTRNHKYDPPSPVRLLRVSGLTGIGRVEAESVAWWDERLPKARPKPEPRKWIGPNLSEPKAEHLDYALTPAPHGQRHALIRDFAAMLASVGYDFEGTMTLCNLLAQSSGYTTRDEKRDVVESVRSAFRKYGRR